MKIWHTFGSEHSMNLRMIGRFQTERDAQKVEDVIKRIGDQLRLDETDLSSKKTRRFTDGMSQILADLDLYILGAEELEQLLYEAHVTQSGSEVRIETEEADISAFLKILVAMGGRVEIYSAHNYPDEEQEGDSSSTESSNEPS